MLQFRADRIATLYLFHPLAKQLQGLGARRIPILMYHSIGGVTPTGNPYYQTDISPRMFAQHMSFLRANGYSTIALEDIWPKSKLTSLPDKPVVITFDDGYRDFLTGAFDTLMECGFTAAVYLPTEYIGDESKTFKGKACLTWGEIRKLQSNGIRFGSHTVTHPKLVKLGWKEIEREISESKRAIEDRLGIPVTSFCYPYAFPANRREFVRRLSALLDEQGYENGVCTVIGCASPDEDPHFLSRVPMNSGDDLSLFQAKLEGGYDWLQKPQYLSKKMGLSWA